VGAGRAVAAEEAAALPLSGAQAVPDREALQGILFVLYTGIAWRHLPLELGFGSGSTCYRRMVEWQRVGVWERLHALLLAELRAAGELEWSRAVADSSHVQAKRGRPDGPEPG
jgi:transposase